MLGEGEVDGEWAEPILGVENLKSIVVWFGIPDGQAKLELAKFHSLTSAHTIQSSFANHIVLAVENLK